jgi:methionyl-tRNA formyltransferase
MTASLLFLGKQGDAYCQKAVQFVRENFADPDVYLSRRGEDWPEAASDWQGDYILSYLSPFIIPKGLLDRAKAAAINFHPGPPEYPGIGCTNFALYNNETTYGVTCHHMAPRVDTGAIIAVRRFDILPDDSVLSLTQRCYENLYNQFMDIIPKIIGAEDFPNSPETWTRLSYKRHELDALCRITPDMAADEIERRIRAVTFPGAPGAFVEIHGHRFTHAGGKPQ